TPEIVAFQDVQGLYHGDATGAWRRRADNLIAAIGSANRLALFHLIVGQVLCRNQAAVALHVRSEFPRHGSFVKIVWLGGNALKSPRQFRLLKEITRLIEVAISLENVFGFAEKEPWFLLLRLGIPVKMHGVSFFIGEPHSVCRQANGGFHYRLQRQLAPVLLRVNQTGNRSRN